jgi:hypothetical protein
MSSSSDVQFNATREFLLGMTSLGLSNIAEPFLQMFDESRHFQIALGVLLPIMNDPKDTVTLRLQAAFLLWYLYRNHSLDMNPFTGAFREALQMEKGRARMGEELASGKADTTIGGEGALALTLEIILAGRASEVGSHQIRLGYLINHMDSWRCTPQMGWLTVGLLQSRGPQGGQHT